MNCTQLQELAAAHALGALDRAGAARLEALSQADPDLQAEVESFVRVARRLAEATPPVPPPPGSRAAVLARVARTPQSPPAVPAGPTEPAAPAGFRFLRPAEGQWMEGPLPGVRVQTLSTDWRRNQMILYLELDPGAVYPDHRHGGSEQLFIVSGDLISGGRLLRAGDFVEGGDGSEHRDVHSPGGCQALLVTSATSVLAEFARGRLKEMGGKLAELFTPGRRT